MCFSIQASFAASFFLAAIAVASFLKVKSQSGIRSAKFGLVAIPAGFALQQFWEGLVWLALLNHYTGFFRKLAIYGFIFFAFLFWPAYIPACMFRLEQNIYVQKLLKIFRIVGLATAALLLERIIYFGVTAQLANCHIMYNLQSAQFNLLLTWLIIGAYLIVTVGALLVSTFPGMRLMGVLVGLSYLVAYFFYLNFLISVWCFLAAIISLLVYWSVAQNN